MILKMLNINGFHGVPHSPWKVTKLLTIVRNRCLPLSFSQLHRFTYPPDCCTVKSLCTFQQPLHLKMKFSIKDFFSICDVIRNFLQIWSHLLKKSLLENFIFLCSELSYIGAQERLFFDTKQLNNKERHLDCNISSIFLKNTKYYENIIQGSSIFFLRFCCYFIMMAFDKEYSLLLKHRKVIWYIQRL